MFWWIYVLVALGIFLSVVIGHYFVKKINEARLEERLEGQRERLTVSAQTSLILDQKPTKKIESKNLKEDKRTFKSRSLVFGQEKSLTRTDLRELINDDSREKRLYDIAIKSHPSGNIETAVSSCVMALPSIETNSNAPVCIGLTPSKFNTDLKRELSEMDLNNIQDKPNSHLHVVKTISSTKSERTAEKLNEESVKSRDSVKDIVLPAIKYDENLDKRDKIHVNTKESVKDISPAFKHNEIPDRINTDYVETDVSIKDMTHSLVSDDNTNKVNNKFVITQKSLQDTTPSSKHIKILDKHNVESMNNNYVEDIPPSSKLDEMNLDESTINMHNLECVKSKDSIKNIISPSLKHDNRKDKHKNEMIKTNDSVRKPLQYDGNIDKKVMEIKNSVKEVSSSKNGENINEAHDECCRTKAYVENILVSLSDNLILDKNSETTSKILREPSSLFFGAIYATPATPKEILEPYENAFTSAKSSKIEAMVNVVSDTVSEHKTADVETSTSKPKSIYDPKRSKDNITSSVSKVIFSTETKTSYIDIDNTERAPDSKPESVISKLSISNGRLNDFSQIKDVSKCTSRVTFAKNAAVVITDSMSMTDNVCVVTPPKSALAMEIEKMSSNEFDIESVSNDTSTRSDSNVDDKENVKKSSFKQSFIDGSVTITSSIFRTNANLEPIENDNKQDSSQTSYDLGKKSVSNVLDKMAFFNLKLIEKLSSVIKDEASTSRSNNIIENSDIIVVHNKFCGDIRSRSKLGSSTSERNVDFSKDDLELDDKVFQTTSLTKLDLKSAPADLKDDINFETKNKTEDDNEDDGKQSHD